MKWGLKMRAGSAEICQKEKGKDGGKIEKEERDTAGGGVGGGDERLWLGVRETKC